MKPIAKKWGQSDSDARQYSFHNFPNCFWRIQNIDLRKQFVDLPNVIVRSEPGLILVCEAAPTLLKHAPSKLDWVEFARSRRKHVKNEADAFAVVVEGMGLMSWVHVQNQNVASHSERLKLSLDELFAVPLIRARQSHPQQSWPPVRNCTHDCDARSSQSISLNGELGRLSPPHFSLLLPHLSARLIHEPDFFALLHILNQLEDELLLHAVVILSGVRQVPGVLGREILDTSGAVIMPESRRSDLEVWAQSELG